MSAFPRERLVPRNGHTLIVGIVARISGCQNKKVLSLDGQIDRGKEVIAELYDGPIEFRTIATKGKGRSPGEHLHHRPACNCAGSYSKLRQSSGIPPRRSKEEM